MAKLNASDYLHDGKPVTFVLPVHLAKIKTINRTKCDSKLFSRP